MKLVIDLDQHAAIQDFAIGAPAPVYDFKSQDTIDWMIYFVRGGIVQDLGAGMAIKYGMIATGDATDTILAYQTAFTYLTDPNGNVYYNCQVVYNTSQMASAISGKTQLPCTAEVRYQTADNEIIHSLNISCLVFPTILVETGVTPPGVSTGYPDASTIELLVHKNVANGYAGLDAQGDITGSIIPVDTQTIVVNSNGDIASAAILTSTTANFTTPASGGTVPVTFVSTANLKALSYVRIPIAGYYIVQSITDATHAVLQNNGDPFNAASGATITSGAVILPAQAAAGGGGGQGAYTATTASFTIPAAGATVAVAVGSTAWMGGNGYGMFITGGGYFLVNSITDSQHVVVTNSGSAANLPPGTTVNSGATVSAAGPMGPAGAAGVSLAAYDTLGASFTMPNAAASVNIQIGNTAWVGTNQVIYIAGGGYFQVASIINATNLSVTNLNYPGNAAAASTVASGAKVSPGGLQGAAGAGGAGLNAFTTLSANFTQPAVNSTVTANVGTTAWMAAGQGVYVQGGGYYNVASVSDLTHAVLTNLGSVGNAAPGSTVTGSGTQTVSPAGVPGINGINAYTTTTAAFTVPAAGASVTVSVASGLWAAAGQFLFLTGAGYYQVATVLSATQLSLTNLNVTGNAATGANIASGAQVSPSGPQGIAGPAGPQGPAGSGGGGGTSVFTPFDPRINGYYLYEDFLWAGISGTTYGNVPPGEWQAVNGAGTENANFYTNDQNAPWAINNTQRAQGIIALTTGTTTGTNNGCCLLKGYHGLTVNGITLGLGPFEMAARIGVWNSTLPASGNSTRLTMGLVNGASALQGNGMPTTSALGNPYQCLFLDWSPDQNSGLFRIGYCAGNNVATAVTYANCTSGAPTAAAFHWWSFKVDLTGTVTVYLDGVLCGTFNSVAPAGMAMLPWFQINRGASVATNFWMYIDALYIYMPYSR